MAHEYVHALARQPRGARRLEWPVVAAAMAEERRMLEAPALLLLLLALGGTGLVDAHLAVRLALWTGVAPARRLGVTCARRQRWGWPTALTAGAVNGTVGLVIVALEVLID